MNRKVEEVLNAATAAAIFGAGADDDKVKLVYKKYARRIHPDMFTDPTEKESASKAFIKLTEFQNQALHKHVKPGATKATNTIKTRKHEYTIGDKTATDDIFDYYDVTFDGGHQRARFAVARNPKNFDLADAYAANAKKVKHFNEEYEAFFPDVIEKFRWQQDNTNYPVVVLNPLDGFYSLKQVRERYPKGLHGRDVAWMFKRVLVAVGITSDAGVTHSGAVETAFRIHPELHGLVLEGWQYSVEKGSTLKAVPKDYKNLYPAAALKKEPVNYNLDVTLAAKTMLSLCGEQTPTPIKAFLKGCMLNKLPEPAVLLGQFDELLINVYGPPKFHQFTMD